MPSRCSAVSSIAAPRARTRRRGSNGAAGTAAAAESRFEKNTSCPCASASWAGRRLPHACQISSAPMWSRRWMRDRSQCRPGSAASCRNCDLSNLARDSSARMSHAPDSAAAVAPSAARACLTSGSRTAGADGCCIVLAVVAASDLAACPCARLASYQFCPDLSMQTPGAA